MSWTYFLGTLPVYVVVGALIGRWDARRRARKSSGLPEMGLVLAHDDEGVFVGMVPVKWLGKDTTYKGDRTPLVTVKLRPGRAMGFAMAIMGHAEMIEPGGMQIQKMLGPSRRVN